MKKKNLKKIIEKLTFLVEKQANYIDDLNQENKDLCGTIDVLLNEDLINEIQKTQDS